MTPPGELRPTAPEPGEARRHRAMLRPHGAPSMTEEEFRRLRELVQAHCGISLRDDARSLVQRRLGPRLAVLGLASFGEYHRRLRIPAARGEELDEAIDLLTTNETYFYREPLQLSAFTREILPVLARELAGERRLRILSAGCSTGEEVYTLAILVKESGLFEGWDVEVVGCDISRRCLAQAREGAYGEHSFRSPEAEPLRRWFQLRGDRWVVHETIRRSVRFSRDNLLDPRALAGVGPADVLLCRNVMIYFDADARRRVLRRLHRTLRGGGWLLLGHSELLLDPTAGFEAVQLRSDLVYRKPSGAPLAEQG